ncbi:MAG: hypothetical protein AAFV95_21825 [Bacteroidota bacterium]
MKKKLKRILSYDVDKYINWIGRIVCIGEDIVSGDIAVSAESVYFGEIRDEEREECKRLRGILSRKARIKDGELITVDDFGLLRIWVYRALDSQIKYFDRRREFGALRSDELKRVLGEIDFDCCKRITRFQPILREEVKRVSSNFRLVKYAQYLSEQVESEKNKSVQKAGKRKGLTLPEKIMLLRELGFFELDKVINLSGGAGKRTKMIALLLSADETNTKKNINALKEPNGGFNPYRHKGILKRLLDS